MEKTFQFKTQCKGVKSHIQNYTDHFGEDTWSNALAALTYLVTLPRLTVWTRHLYQVSVILLQIMLHA